MQTAPGTKVEYRTWPHTKGVIRSDYCAAPSKHQQHVLVEFDTGTLVDTLVSSLREEQQS